MTEVLIDHCVLKVVRHGGWSWGSAPRQLFQNAVQRLPELLAQKLASLLIDQRDIEITTPLCIRLHVTMGELLNAAENSLGTVNGLSSLDQQLTEKLATVLADQLTDPQDGQECVTHQAEPISTYHTEVEHESLLDILRSLYSEGTLAALLKGCSLGALEAWHRTLLEEATATASRRSTEALHIDLYIKAYRARFTAQTDMTSADVRAEQLRIRLWVLAAMAADNESLPDRTRLESILDDCLPLPEAAQNDLPLADTYVASDRDQVTERDSIHKPHNIMQREPVDSRLPGPLLDADCYVASALPFLLLGPLEQLGYLRLLRMTFALTRQPQWFAACFAAGFALKALQPLERGWRRHPEDRAIAAVFAGRDSPLDEDMLVTFAQETSGLLSPLNAVLAQALQRGHRAGQPLLLSRIPAQGGGGLILFDVEGLFPIAWCSTVEELLPVIQGFESDILLVPQHAADTQLLRHLDAADVPFLTDAPPTRDEHWYMLQGKDSKRLWSNSSTLSEFVPARHAQHFNSTAEDAADCVKALTLERKVISLSHESELERTLTLGAGVALASIAWTLWQERESTHPLLTLQRFADLDARVSFRNKQVHVRLPLGQRHRDLYEHGLTRDIPNVPWFGGRTVEFSGG